MLQCDCEIEQISFICLDHHPETIWLLSWTLQSAYLPPLTTLVVNYNCCIVFKTQINICTTTPKIIMDEQQWPDYRALGHARIYGLHAGKAALQRVFIFKGYFNYITVYVILNKIKTIYSLHNLLYTTYYEYFQQKPIGNHVETFKMVRNTPQAVHFHRLRLQRLSGDITWIFKNRNPAASDLIVFGLASATAEPLPWPQNVHQPTSWIIRKLVVLPAMRTLWLE